MVFPDFYKILFKHGDRCGVCGLSRHAHLSLCIQDNYKLDICALNQKSSIAVTGLKIHGTSSLVCLVGPSKLVGDPLLQMPGFLLYY